MGSGRVAGELVDEVATSVVAARAAFAPDRPGLGPGPDSQKSREIAWTTVAVSETSSPNAW